ncbi:MAG: hypothetical protein PHP52_15000, partial [Bacteroidales bacterium]|nr:hypothetical protein [Bacteroidales bacterium]
MKTHPLVKTLAIFALMSLFVSAAAAAGGSGTIGDPYIITTPAELQAMNTGLSAYYALGNDIDMSGYAYTAVGSLTNPFSGGLDGNNYTISSLYISAAATNYQGLFGVIGPGTLCTDIQLYDFSVSGQSEVGGLFGQIIMSDASNATCYITNVDISHSRITGSDDGGSYVGGIGGQSYNYSNIILNNCDANYCVITSGALYCGGLMGAGAYTNSQATATDCTVGNCVITSGDSGCGGLMGFGAADNSQATATDCFVANCEITSGVSDCGGLIGYGAYINSQATATDCFVANCVITSEYPECGGLMGYGAYRDSQATATDCTVGNCVITSEYSRCGGLMGYGAHINSQATATDCFVAYCEMTSPEDCGEFDGGNSIILDNNVGISNIINGYYHAELDTDLYLVKVTEDTNYFYITITPPNGLAYNVSKNLFYTEASYDLIGSAWTTHSGEYSFSMPKTSGATTATAGYVALYRNGYSDYIYWGFPTDANPIIISEIDVPTTGNTGDAISLTAS